MVAQVDRNVHRAPPSISQPSAQTPGPAPGRVLVLTGLVVLVLALGTLAAVPALFASTPVPSSTHATSEGSKVSDASSSSSTNSTTNVGLNNAILALAAAICMAGGFIGTGMAQSGIGASGMGIIAERREKFGTVLVFFVIPETLWILGFVFGILLLKQTL